MPTDPREPRGARDLAQLWHTLPAAALAFPLREPSRELTLATISNELRGRAWREHCAKVADAPCVERRRDCALSDTGRCVADVLFPMHVGGGAPQWRMATLFVRWRRQQSTLQLIAIGEVASRVLGWAARYLRERHGLREPAVLPVHTFGDLVLRGDTRWRVAFITPWIVLKRKHEPSKAAVQKEDPDDRAVLRELGKSMASKSQKLTALCTREVLWQRLGGHLARYAADNLLPSALRVDQLRIKAETTSLRSVGNDAHIDAVTWQGWVSLTVAETALPWLSLLAVCGGGENADEGFGMVEIIPDATFDDRLDQADNVLFSLPRHVAGRKHQ